MDAPSSSGSLPFPQRLSNAGALVARMGLLLVLFVLLDRGLGRLVRLPAAAFDQPFLLGTWLGTLPVLYSGVLLVGSVLLALFVRTRPHPTGWQAFAHAVTLRRLVLLAVGLLVWIYATYDYNLYLNQTHFLDRLLLIILGVLVYRHPGFLFPLLVVLLLLMRQFVLPIGGYNWTIPMLPARMLMIVGAGYIGAVLTRRVRTQEVIFLICTLIAAQYWIPGWGKLEIGWLRYEQVSFFLPASYLNGWLGFLEPPTIAQLTRLLSVLSEPMKIATVVFECGALVCLWRRGAVRFFLVVWPMLHLGIFLVSGFFFWLWMVLDIGVMLLFFRKHGAPSLPIFTPVHFVLSLILIAGSPLWFRPAKLAWHDIRVSHAYRFEARLANGQSYHLPLHFFDPYRYPFRLSIFHYLTDTPTFGGMLSQGEVAAAFAAPTTPEDVFMFEQSLGKDSFNTARIKRFDHFMQRFAGHWNVQQSHQTPWHWLQPPPNFITFNDPRFLENPAPIEAVSVYQVTSLFDDASYREIRTHLVREIPIPPPDSIPPLAYPSPN